MIPDIESYYERIATSIEDVLPEGWTNAKFVAIFYSDSTSWEPEFRSSAGELRTFDVSNELMSAFEDLRQSFIESGNPVWGQAIFELSSDGKFNMKLGYDNCDENGDAIWNEEEWNQRYEERRRRLTQ